MADLVAIYACVVALETSLRQHLGTDQGRPRCGAALPSLVALQTKGTVKFHFCRRGIVVGGGQHSTCRCSRHLRTGDLRPDEVTDTSLGHDGDRHG